MPEVKSRIGIFPNISPSMGTDKSKSEFEEKSKIYMFFPASAWEAVLHILFYDIGISRASPYFLSSLSRVIPKSRSPSSSG